MTPPVRAQESSCRNLLQNARSTASTVRIFRDCSRILGDKVKLAPCTKCIPASVKLSCSQCQFQLGIR
eukprot:413176-Amphidinium_carterae.1